MNLYLRNTPVNELYLRSYTDKIEKNLSVYDSINITEDNNVLIEILGQQDLNINIYDQVVIDDITISEILYLNINTEDNINLIDTVNAEIYVDINNYDNINVNDVQVIEIISTIYIYDNISISELLNISISSISIINIDVNDNINVNENLLLLQDDLNINYNDLITAQDSINSNFDININIYDNINLSDTINSSINVENYLIDNIIVSDNIDTNLGINLSIIDNINLIDIISIQIEQLEELNVNIVENINLTEYDYENIELLIFNYEQLLIEDNISVLIPYIDIYNYDIVNINDYIDIYKYEIDTNKIYKIKLPISLLLNINSDIFEQDKLYNKILINNSIDSYINNEIKIKLPITTIKEYISEV